MRWGHSESRQHQSWVLKREVEGADQKREQDTGIGKYVEAKNLNLQLRGEMNQIFFIFLQQLTFSFDSVATTW